MASKRKRETAAQKIGYRWMMQCLRALDANAGDLKRLRSVVATDDHLKVVVHHADARDYKGGWRSFRKAVRAAANEALALLRTGSFVAGYATMRPGAMEQGSATPFPRSFKVVFTLRRF